MSGRAIERKHHVGRRTIIKALASAEPPERKKIHREPAALDGLHGHIDAMLKANPEITTAAIWQQLADQHGRRATQAHRGHPQGHPLSRAPARRRARELGIGGDANGRVAWARLGR
jgi:hypothetical protein